MAQLNIPNTIDQNTTADAVEVEQNFSVIQSYVNTDVIRRDGGVAMEAPLLLNAGDPTADNHAANKNYVDALMPIGTIMMFGGNNAPAGNWHLCNGTSLAVATYPELYKVLGVRYGGSGGTFKLPNFAARVPIGMASSQTRFDTTGKTGGNTVVPVPSHTHTINHDHGSLSHTHSVNIESEAVLAPQGTVGTNSNSEPGTVQRAMNSNGTGSTANPIAAPASATHSHGVTGTTGSTAVNLPAYNGASGAFSKEINLNLAANGTLIAPIVETTTEHIPPFVVVQYIIRVDPQ